MTSFWNQRWFQFPPECTWISYMLARSRCFKTPLSTCIEMIVGAGLVRSLFYIYSMVEGLNGTGYAARQIKGELIPVHDGGRYHDKLNLHDTIIVSVFYHDKR